MKKYLTIMFAGLCLLMTACSSKEIDSILFMLFCLIFYLNM